jgi:hypothetical protein
MPEPDSQTLRVVMRAEKSTWQINPRLTRRVGSKPPVRPRPDGELLARRSRRRTAIRCIEGRIQAKLVPTYVSRLAFS